MSLSWYNGFSPKLREESFRWQKARIASGELRPACRCNACGETEGPIDYHTEDYSKPFGPHIHAHELCFRCHMALHARNRAPQMWSRYIEQLEAGARYEPLPSRREIGRVWEAEWVERPMSWGPRRPRQEFFRSLVVGRSVVSNPDADVQGILFG